MWTALHRRAPAAAIAFACWVLHLATPAASEAAGWCAKCGTIHRLPTTPGAVAAARALRDALLADANASAMLEKDRGKMVGVLECLDESSGEMVYLRAFAGKFGGQWEREGWSPVIGVPPPQVDDFVSSATEVGEMMSEISALESRLQLLSEHDAPANDALRDELVALRERQRQRATEGLRALQRQMIALNFRGEERALADVFVRQIGAVKKLPRGGAVSAKTPGVPSGKECSHTGATLIINFDCILCLEPEP